MINADGKRFVDEGADFRNYTYAKYGRVILEQPGQFAWQIFDAKVQHLLRDEYRIKQVTKVRADTLEELARQARRRRTPSSSLKTIKEYNKAVMTDVPFNPNVKDGRGTEGLAVPKSNWANTIDTPPFEGYAVTCGITFTFGGVRINTDGQVLDTDDQPIPGLYAAGELVGGIFYFNYPGGTGLTNGAVFGKIAGTSRRRMRPVSHSLRRAGAVILGKTATCEFAGMAPPETTNPHNPAHTPGGSSSGSGAAVADHMVPAALGTQTGGSVLRPSSYCGIFGYKPTYNTFNKAGVKPAAESIDTIGWLARSIEDIELLTACADACRNAAVARARSTLRHGSVSTAPRCGTWRSLKRSRRSKALHGVVEGRRDGARD